jgi:hypothetical protein
VKPLSIYTVCNTLSYNASTYYRLDVPLTTMEEVGLPVEPIVDNGDPSIPNENRIRAICQSDINLFYQPVSDNLLEQMTRLSTILPAKDASGTYRYPPSFICDTDDNLFMVHPMNPAYKDLGIRMPNGRLLKPGDEVGSVDATGKKRVMWRDGENGFAIQANLAKLTSYRDILAAAEGVTCSTPRVAKYVTAESGQTNTFVNPNMVRFDHYDDIRLAPHDDEVWVMWQGSTTHFEDFYEIRNALPLIVKRYRNVKFILFGALDPWIVQNLPSDRFHYIPWCRYTEYKLRLATIGHDISIAPLRPHAFNQCRSAIKAYESWVLHRPAAFLGEGGDTPYGDEIINGETGLLWTTTEEFVEKLSLLIENTALRKRLAANGRDWLSENRDAMKLVRPLYDFYQSVRARKRDNTPLPTPEQWAERKAEIFAATQAQLAYENSTASSAGADEVTESVPT